MITPIQNIFFNINNRPELNFKQSSKPSFKGHLGHETIKYLGEDLTLIQETGFFRGSKSLKLMVDYLNTIFKNIKKSIVVGGCSTGEEVYSVKMLMENNPVHITGIDLSKNAITFAKNGVYPIYIPLDKKADEVLKLKRIHAYDDAYLSDKDRQITKEEKKYAAMFSKMFEMLNVDNINTSFGKFKSLVRHEIDNESFFLGSRMYKLKTPQKDCEFMQGDICDILYLFPNNKHHAITFRNALYHIAGMRNDISKFSVSYLEAKTVMHMLFRDINKALEKYGLFVMGEREDLQGVDTNLVRQILSKYGFESFGGLRSEENIWIKTKEI